MLVACGHEEGDRRSLNTPKVEATLPAHTIAIYRSMNFVTFSCSRAEERICSARLAT